MVKHKLKRRYDFSECNIKEYAYISLVFIGLDWIMTNISYLTRDYSDPLLTHMWLVAFIIYWLIIFLIQISKIKVYYEEF